MRIPQNFEQRLKDYLACEQQQFHCEYRIRHQNETYLWVLTRGKALRDEAGIAYRFMGCLTDMAARAPLQPSSYAQQEQVQTIFQTLAIGMVSNLAGLYLYEGRYGEAEPLLQGILAMRIWLLGPTHLDVALSLYTLSDPLR